ncbi:MAG: glucose-6-phosphate isomerase [Myxococcota bacterium]
MTAADAVARLLARDDAVFPRARLGWLDAPARPAPCVDSPPRCDRALLLGMGGSSLAAQVYVQWGLAPRALRLRVLDSVAPSAIRKETDAFDPARTLVVGVSKSGTTAETLALLAHFAPRVPADHLLAVTDPGTPLEARARAAGWRLASSEPNIGGRYSALATAGLLPATLMGLPVGAVLEGAREEAARFASEGERSAAARLAKRLASARVVALDAPHLSALAWWAEQLVAESTGKLGRGVLPIVGDTPEGAPRELLDPGDSPALGAIFFRWEAAVALCGALLGVNPFDEPDVDAGKRATRAVLGGESPDVAAWDDAPTNASLAALLEGDDATTACLLVYAAPTAPRARLLAATQRRLRARTGLPVTWGFGPRYLHSTGQFHKGGPPGGRFLVVLVDEGPDLPIPGAPYSFGALFEAQARGDCATLAARGRRVLGVRVRADALAQLLARL